MTETEFLILDELYFVISFDELKNNIEFKEKDLVLNLEILIKKEWVKILNSNRIDEIEYDSEKFQLNFNSYCYLATKKGLFEHNSN